MYPALGVKVNCMAENAVENAAVEVLQVSVLYPVPQALISTTPFTGVRSEAVTPTAVDPGAPDSSLLNV